MAAFDGPDTLLMMYPGTAAMMVIDESSAEVTSTFPLGGIFGSGEAADSVHGLIYVGGGSGGYLSGSNMSVVSTKDNRVVRNLAADGFAPVALAAGQIYGTAPLIAQGASVFNLKSGAYTALPLPYDEQDMFDWIWFSGGAPANGATYWIPWELQNQLGDILWAALAVYDTATNALVAVPTIPASNYDPMAFSPDSSKAYLGEPNAIAVFNTTTFRNTTTFSYDATFSALAVSPDGSEIYASDGNNVYFIDAATGSTSQTTVLPAGVQGNMAISPDGSSLFLMESYSNAVEMVNTTTGQVTVIAVPYQPTSVVALP
jgi:DNA-binding beta-propeller fold protein YncE